MVEVTFEPGQKNSPHHHTGPVFGYVLEGEYEHALDDEPVKMDDFFQEVARLAGRRGVGHAPLFLARLLRGKGAVAAAVRSARSSNARVKAELGWTPRYPDYRSGLAATFAALGRAAAA